MILENTVVGIKTGFATGLLAVVAACSSGSIPTATPTNVELPRPSPTATATSAPISPTNTPAPLSRATPTNTPAPTISITFPPPEELVMTPQASEATGQSTYKVIFPFKDPSSSLEEYVFNNNDALTYMKFVRAKANFVWAVSLADLVNQSINPLNWNNFFEKNKELIYLSPYVPLEDFRIFQQIQENYQGTRVEANSAYFQQTATRKLIPLENPDMDKQIFEELRKEFLAKIITPPVTSPDTLDWIIHKGPFNSGYVPVTVDFTWERVWETTLKDSILSPAVISGNRLYVGDHFNSFISLSTEDGSKVWEIGRRYWEKDATPAAFGNIVLFGTNHERGSLTIDTAFIVAIDVNTQEELWTSDAWPLSPIIDRGNMYVVDDSDTVKSVNIIDGSQNWAFGPAANTFRYTLKDEDGDILTSFSSSSEISSYPIIKNNIVYFTNTNLNKVDIYALDTEGNLLWKSDVTPSRHDNDGIAVTYNHLTAVGDILIWRDFITRLEDPQNAYMDSCVRAFDTITGKIVLDHCIMGEENDIESIVSDGNDVYVAYGKNIAQFTVDGNILKEKPLIGLEGYVADLLLTDNVLFVATDKNVTAIDRKNLDLRHKIIDLESGEKHLSFSDGSLYLVAGFFGYNALYNGNAVFKFSQPAK